ncbi:MULTISPECIES: hypothetical protein [Hyphomicrobiales]|uniref:hypothetical protein n=1 Tax=Hyphomicrobiales TaxID=356 RepID=UPI001BCB317C|nr:MULTISPECIES: hypothetical protein [Hyphomicrobiales]CAH1662844.1 hypothetical protein CHELA41_22278 [Hyphomicrobiales bacterium]MBS7741488.1 hypothetical protein [Chelatococcus sp. HY11]MBX3491201.1 hypothetical protein [Parvibaculum sp.]MBX3544493.1 hypothetical protein [Chelatococcus sp.]MCO5078984.1 hypothetical protein [Chelatococcus sp.]
MTNGDQPGPSVHLALTSDEALVLFEFLSQVLDRRELSHVAGDAERRVLSAMVCDLETTLSAPLAADYHLQLAAARQRIAHSAEGLKPDELSAENDG